MFTRYHGGGVGHMDPTDVEEAENIEPEEVVDDGRANLPNDLVEFNKQQDESSDTEGEGDENSDPGESSDEETAGTY